MDDLREVILYLPQRRFAITPRDVAVENPINDAQVRSKTLNTVLNHFKNRSDEYANHANVVSPGPGAAIRSQFDMLRYRDRDENDEKIDTNYAQPPREQFGGNALPLRDRREDMSTDEEMGVFEPIWAFAADNNGNNVLGQTRKLTGFKVGNLTEMGRQLLYVRGLVDGVLPQTEVMMFDMLRTRSPAQKLGPQMNNNHGFGLALNNQMVFPPFHAAQRVHFLFKKTSIDPNANPGYVTLNGLTCKYIYHDNRYITPAKTQTVAAAVNQVNQALFASGSNIFHRIGNPNRFVINGVSQKISEFVDFQTWAQHHYGAQDGQGPLDIRLLPTDHNNGFVQPIADTFYDNNAISQTNAGVRVLYPVRNLRLARVGWNFKYGPVIVVNAQNKLLFEEIAIINPIYPILVPPIVALLTQPNDPATGAPWIIPAGLDPDDLASYATYPRGLGDPGLVAIQDAYFEIQLRNSDDLYYDLQDVLTGVGSIRYLNNALFANENKPIVRSRFTGFHVTEPLLSMCGMSQFRPDKIMPQMNKFPGMLQDFELRVKKTAVVKYKNLPDLEGLTVELIGEDGFEIQTYSQDSFDQNVKNLQKIDILVPKFRKYTKTFAPGDKKTIVCSNELGPPDYVFIKAERISETGEEYFDDYPPIVSTIKLSIINENIETVSQLNDVQLYQATRRNSNFRSDSRKNREKIGAVLLSRSDFGNWSRYSQFESVDVFRGEFEITTQNRSPTAPVLTTTENALLLTRNERVDIIMIYENYHLGGTVNDLKFWYL